MTIVLFTIILYLLLIVIFVSLTYSAIRYVPFVPTESRVIKQMIENAGLRDGQHVYDLGCGDGRLLIEALKKSKIKATGVEVNFFITWLAKFRLWLSGKKATILRANFFDVPLNQSDIIFCYLFPKVMKKLKVKFENELKNGATIISYCFPLKDWKPYKTIQTRKDKPNNFLIYIYRTPCQL